MRRSLPLMIIVLAVMGLFGTSRLPSAVAQSSTPMAAGTPSPGEQALAVGHVDALPPAPADLALVRFTLQPGEAMPIEKTDPTLALAYIESGTLTVRFDAPLTVTRASAMNALMATPQAMGMPATEQIPANTDGTLTVGDCAVGLPYTSGELRNDGTVPVVVLASLISPSAPAAAATPSAGAPSAAGGGTTVAVGLAEMTITPAITTFKVGQPYTFVVTNNGTTEHEMVIEQRGADDQALQANGQEAEAADLDPGQTKTLVWTFTKPGDYQLACHVPGHYEAGMVTAITVTP